MNPHVFAAEEACEIQIVLLEMRAKFARLWRAAQESGTPELIAECREVVPDLAEVERHTKRIARLADERAVEAIA